MPFPAHGGQVTIQGGSVLTDGTRPGDCSALIFPTPTAENGSSKNKCGTVPLAGICPLNGYEWTKDSRPYSTWANLEYTRGR